MILGLPGREEEPPPRPLRLGQGEVCPWDVSRAALTSEPSRAEPDRASIEPSFPKRPGLNTYPADEKRISEVERGHSCEAVVPLPSGQTLSAGDDVLFALCLSRGGQPPAFVKGGDSVLVSVTEVTDLNATDPATGHALVRVSWKPLGQHTPSARSTGRGSRPRRSLGRA